MHHRTNIFGAPGSGTTTLGRALAARLGYTFFDTDDYYWFTDDLLPYRRKRNPEHRLRLLAADLERAGNCVVSGALLGWGDALLPGFDAVVYRWLPTETRMERISQRETARYGAERIAPGGDLHGVFEKFLLWAADYDHAPETRQRGHLAEVAWLKNGCQAPVLSLTDDLSVPELMEKVHYWLQTDFPGF